MLKTKRQTEYYDVFLTDIQMHVVEPRKPLPWYRAILKSFRNKKPGRFFTKDFSMIKKYKTFRGSESTLIAAEKMKRRCYMIEKSPVYCEAIKRQWEKLTNLKTKEINHEKQ